MARLVTDFKSQAVHEISADGTRKPIGHWAAKEGPMHGRLVAHFTKLLLKLANPGNPIVTFSATALRDERFTELEWYYEEYKLRGVITKAEILELSVWENGEYILNLARLANDRPLAGA